MWDHKWPGSSKSAPSLTNYFTNRNRRVVCVHTYAPSCYAGPHFSNLPRLFTMRNWGGVLRTELTPCFPLLSGQFFQMRRVVHCKKTPFDVYIGRGSKWGNPFVIGRDGTRKEVIQKYRVWIMAQPELIAALPELKGKVLGCWCCPQECHGDVLVAMAEGKFPTVEYSLL